MKLNEKILVVDWFERRRKKEMFNQAVNASNQIGERNKINSDLACSQGEGRHVLIAIVRYVNVSYFSHVQQSTR